jgi:hypothetical protein
VRQWAYSQLIFIKWELTIYQGLHVDVDALNILNRALPQNTLWCDSYLKLEALHLHVVN